MWCIWLCCRVIRFWGIRKEYSLHGIPFSPCLLVWACFLDHHNIRASRHGRVSNLLGLVVIFSLFGQLDFPDWTTLSGYWTSGLIIQIFKKWGRIIFFCLFLLTRCSILHYWNGVATGVEVLNFDSQLSCLIAFLHFHEAVKKARHWFSSSVGTWWWGMLFVLWVWKRL